MGQFIFGLIAGVTVGLVMEWVIDWTGLLPERSAKKRSVKNPIQNAVIGSPAPRIDDQTSNGSRPSFTSSPSNLDASGE